jgi:Leucine-rich repeat (LRR) protein
VEPIAKKVRVLDGTDNKLTAVPEYVGDMALLNRLNLSRNRLTALPDALAACAQLRVLLLDGNRLRAVPACVFALARLERLDLSRNAISELPRRVRHLSALKVLDVSANALRALPRELGQCDALEELRVGSNAELAALPVDLAKLERLRLVIAEDTAIAAVPGEVLRFCENLQTLALHGCPITAAALEATDGFAEFEARRVRKWDKAVAAGVLLGAKTGLAEAADREVPFWKQATLAPAGRKKRGGGKGEEGALRASTQPQDTGP